MAVRRGMAAFQDLIDPRGRAAFSRDTGVKRPLSGDFLLPVRAFGRLGFIKLTIVITLSPSGYAIIPACSVIFEQGRSLYQPLS